MGPDLWSQSDLIKAFIVLSASVHPILAEVFKFLKFILRASVANNICERNSICDHQSRNQELFRAGEISWNRGTFTNISSATHEKRPSR